MNIKRTIITTATIVVAVAMVASVAGAQTPTVAQLMQEIAQLQAQLQGLQGSTSTTTTTSGSGNPAACAGVTFTRNLTVGSTGQDVKCLQTILNQSSATQVSTTGAGSPGYETTYFGSRTLAAVRIWQANAGFVPANQIGPLSRAKLNAQLGGTTSTSTTTTTTTTTNPTSTGPISAMLSSDTPASGAIINSQSTADLLHIAFSGVGTVTSVTLQRSGISDQNTLSNVYLYNGNTRVTDGYSFNVSGKITINGLNIAVNGAQTISVKADVAAAANATSSSVVVTLVGYTANGTVSSANVMGNTMNVVAGNIATATLGANTVAAANVNAGTSAYTFWSAPIQVNVRAIMLKGANFRMIGSAPSDALANISMFVDGVNTGKTATVTPINGSNYASFDFTSAPISLATGSHTIDMRGDVQKGSNRNIVVSLQQAADLTLTDPQYGVNLAVGGTVPNNAGQISILTGSATVVIDPTFQAMTNIAGGTTNALIGKFKVHAYGEDVKVSTLTVTPTLVVGSAATATATATVTVTPVTTTFVITNAGSGYTAAPTVTITAGTSTCATLPTATATIVGGAVTAITVNNTPLCAVAGTVTVAMTAPVFTAVGGLNNVTLYFNGSQVGTQTSWTLAQMTAATPIAFSLGSQMIAPAGQDSSLEVHADLQTSTGVSYTAGTVGANLVVGASNAQGQTSLNALNFPTALVTGTTLAIQTGLLTVAQNTGYPAQTVGPNTAGVKIGSFVMQNQSTSESVRVTSLTVALGGTEAITNLANLRTSITSGSGANPIQPSTTNTFSVNETLAPGQSETVNIIADSSTQTAVNVVATLTAASIGVTSNVSSAGTATAGQTITFNTGTLSTPSLTNGSSSPSQYIASGPNGATDASLATFNFVSAAGTANITELKFTVTNSTVTSVRVGTVSASPVAGVIYLTGLSLPVPLGGGGLNQPVYVSYVPVGSSGIIPNTTSLLSLVYAKYTSGGTTLTICVNGQNAGGGNCNTAIAAVAANTMTMVGSVPTVAVTSNFGNDKTAISQTGFNLGQVNKIGEVTITAPASGSVKINALGFVTSSANITTFAITSPYLSDNINGTAIGTASGCGATVTATTIVYCELGTAGNTFASGINVGGTESKQDFDGYTIAASTSKTFSLYGTVTGTQTANTSSMTVSTSLLNTASPSSFDWDDASYATFILDGTATAGSSATPNAGTNGTNLNAQLIYGFPTNTYSVHN
jgi:hypothetical protein